MLTKMRALDQIFLNKKNVWNKGEKFLFLKSLVFQNHLILILINYLMFGSKILPFSRAFLSKHRLMYPFQMKFSTQKLPLERVQLKQMRDKLMKNVNQYSPTTIIKAIFTIKSNQQNQILKPQQLQFLISSLQNQLPKLSHEDLTLLLELMKKIPQYKKYNKNQEIFRLLAKKLNMIKSIKLNEKYLFRFLFALDDMKFPTLIFIKYVNYVINEHFDSKSLTTLKKSREIQPIDSLRMYLLLLEKRQIPLSFMQKITQSMIYFDKCKKFHEFCYMYHINKNIHLLEGKVKYFLDRQEAYQVIFNPYKQSENEEEVEKQRKILLENEESELKELKQFWNTKVNEENLKKRIIKFIVDQGQDLTTSTVILIADIFQLKPHFTQFMKKNYKKMMIHEFFMILKHIQMNQRESIFSSYREQYYKNMNIVEKITFLDGGNKYCNIPISKKAVEGVIQNVERISYRQFEIFCEFMIKNVDDSHHKSILQRVQKIVDNMEDN